MSSRFTFLVAGALVLTAGLVTAAAVQSTPLGAAPGVTVYKTPT
jgi:hypothetical protein